MAALTCVAFDNKWLWAGAPDNEIGAEGAAAIAEALALNATITSFGHAV